MLYVLMEIGSSVLKPHTELKKKKLEKYCLQQSQSLGVHKVG